MVKTRYSKLDPNHMARVEPKGSDGKEIPASLLYDQVEVAAKYSQQDCKLDNLLDSIEEEMSGSQGDLLQEPSQLHERVRQAMRSVAKALWPSASPPGSMGELV